MIGRASVCVLALAFGSHAVLAQQPGDGRYVVPWASAGIGTGAVRASCSCANYTGGATFDGTLGAGMDLTRNVSLGLELTSLTVILADEHNASQFRMTTTRLSSSGVPLSLKIGLGEGSYAVGSDALVKNRFSGALGLDLATGRAIDGVAFIDVFAASPGARRPSTTESTQPAIRYRLFAAHAGYALRVHFGN